jgi:cytochrome c553
MAAGESIAKDRCAVCHGEQGQSVAPDFPRLAGQNASYMHKQLMDFADGRRQSAVMLGKARQLTSEQMYALGLYYQSLKPAVTLVADAQLAQVGQFVYDRGNPHSALPACVTCHGTGARGTTELPRLAGQHPEYIIKQVKAFKSGDRANDNTIMHLIASRVSDMELQAVAANLGGLKCSTCSRTPGPARPVGRHWAWPWGCGSAACTPSRQTRCRPANGRRRACT